MKRRVGVLMGGPSYERDISIRSGKAVCHALEKRKFDVVPVELEADLTLNGYRDDLRERIYSSGINVVFIALHGEFGEDGTIQEILEDISIPYTGSRVSASRLGMDKIGSKGIFISRNIPVPEYIVVDKTFLDKRKDMQLYFNKLGAQLVVKPYDKGSSIGLSVVDKESDFYRALSDVFKYSDKAIVEEYIRGREITVGIFRERALPIVEIVPKEKVFDFEAKYKKGITEYYVPADMDREEYRRCQETALLAHKAIGAYFFSRVDMILTKEGSPLVLELNTIPGLTETSLFPKAALAYGINFEDVVIEILESAYYG